MYLGACASLTLIVLQTALCLQVEAVHTDVPNLLREERMGIRICYEPEFRDMLATEAEIAQEAAMLTGNVFKLGDSEVSEATTSSYDDGLSVEQRNRLADDTHDFDSELQLGVNRASTIRYLFYFYIYF
jgi:hypothetical protein